MKREQVLMTEAIRCYQIQALLDNGALILFGISAPDSTAMEVSAEAFSRIPAASVVRVTPLDPPRKRVSEAGTIPLRKGMNDERRAG